VRRPAEVLGDAFAANPPFARRAEEVGLELDGGEVLRLLRQVREARVTRARVGEEQDARGMKLEGKVAVITGAAGGIGREAALLFSSEGARVCVADVGREAGEKTASECRDAFFFPADVSDPKSVESMYAETAKSYGKIDVLYNNAGIMPPDDDSILVTEPDAWDRVQAVNAKGVYLCCKYGIPHLLKAGGGSVINVASFVAILGAATSQIAYTASKGAVLSMSRELAVQFARQGVRVNALCPGPVETPLLMRIFNEDPAAYQRRRVHLPMGRLAKAREIANAALFLASDESSYVNGATFLVDGGLTAAYVTPE
jgi:NAD(P)-dependent dehydrogenase (short-subunit alcohol dehydrogenase family)